MQPIFSYWTGDDLSVHRELNEHWRAEFPHFAIHGDATVRPLIARYFPGMLDVFDEIRIPTAKSDVALLILLYELGGLYIDCHCGFSDTQGVRALLASLLEYDAVFVDRVLDPWPRPLDEHLVINSIMFARPRLELFRRSCGQALSNFSRQRDRERAEGFVPYDIWLLSGPGLVTAMLMEPGSFNRDARAEHEGRVLFIREEVSPVQRNRFRRYSDDGAHWSVRQESEGLFVQPLPAPAPHARSGAAGETAAVPQPTETPLTSWVQTIGFDLPQPLIDEAAAVSPYPDLLLEIVDTSRRYLNFYAAHRPYTINYPWVVTQLAGLAPGSALLDIGSGVSPVPLFLAEKGLFVDCVDGSEFERKLPAAGDWNEWGFLDYGGLHANLRSFNVKITDFRPQRTYDAIYSVSVIAHFPARERDETMWLCFQWLKPGGRIIFAIDLIPRTDALWNGGDPPQEGGNRRDLEALLARIGFLVRESSVTRGLSWSRTDLYFLVAEKPATQQSSEATGRSAGWIGRALGRGFWRGRFPFGPRR